VLPVQLTPPLLEQVSTVPVPLSATNAQQSWPLKSASDGAVALSWA